MNIPEIELASKEAIIAYQENALREVLQYVNEYAPFYKKKFEAAGIDIRDIQTLSDLSKLPFTTKNDLQQYNKAFYCVPKSKIVDYSTTSGTLGDPVVFGLTDKDLDRLAYNEAMSFSCAGIQPGDVVQLMTTIDRRFMAGLAYFLGIRKLGASIIRVGSGVPQLQWDSILQFEPKYIIAVPSFVLKLIEFAESHHIDYKNCSVKGIICIGEALRTGDLSDSLLTQKIKQYWDVDLYSTYASTEMGAAFTECNQFQGGHHHPELIITEILDENNQEVAPGEPGELTITTLGVEGLPLIRFKTGDIVRLHDGACGCGRNTYRIGPVEGRKQQMIKYKGTTLYPPAMLDVLASYPNVDLYLIEVQTNDIGTDEIMISIATKLESEDFLDEIRDRFRAKLRVTPSIKCVPFETLHKIVFNPLSRKPIYFIDKR